MFMQPPTELAEAFASFVKGGWPSAKEVSELAANDKLGSGHRACVELVRSLLVAWARRVELRSIFAAYDATGDGSIDAQEFLVLTTLRPRMREVVLAIQMRIHKQMTEEDLIPCLGGNQYRNRC